MSESFFGLFGFGQLKLSRVISGLDILLFIDLISFLADDLLLIMVDTLVMSILLFEISDEKSMDGFNEHSNFGSSASSNS